MVKIMLREQRTFLLTQGMNLNQTQNWTDDTMDLDKQVYMVVETTMDDLYFYLVPTT